MSILLIWQRRYLTREALKYCDAQARIGKGWPSRQKASKLKALPRAYIKVGRHLPTTTRHLISLNYWSDCGQVRQVEVRGGV